MEYFASPALAQKYLKRRFPSDMLPESEMEMYFAWKLTRSTGGGIAEFRRNIRTMDRLDLFKAFGYLRTDHYLELEHKKPTQ